MEQLGLPLNHSSLELVKIGRHACDNGALNPRYIALEKTATMHTVVYLGKNLQSSFAIHSIISSREHLSATSPVSSSYPQSSVYLATLLHHSSNVMNPSPSVS